MGTELMFGWHCLHAVQVWIILELCTGGTLLDAALGGKFRLDAADSNESRMEMVSADALTQTNWRLYPLCIVCTGCFRTGSLAPTILAA